MTPELPPEEIETDCLRYVLASVLYGEVSAPKTGNENARLLAGVEQQEAR